MSPFITQNPMYEAGVVATVTARHVLPGAEGPEGQPHSHDYRIEVTVWRAHLDPHGMVVDIDILKASLASVLVKIEGRLLDEVINSEADGITVEVLARWMHNRLREQIDHPEVSLGVRIWESPDAFGGYISSNSP